MRELVDKHGHTHTYTHMRAHTHIQKAENECVRFKGWALVAAKILFERVSLFDTYSNTGAPLLMETLSVIFL